jgi:hypothetical protein
MVTSLLQLNAVAISFIGESPDILIINIFEKFFFSPIGERKSSPYFKSTKERRGVVIAQIYRKFLNVWIGSVEIAYAPYAYFHE